MIRLLKTPGQSLSEYALLAGIIAIGSLAALTVFGNSLTTATNTIAKGDGTMTGITGNGAKGSSGGPSQPSSGAYNTNYATAAASPAGFAANDPNPQSGTFSWDPNAYPGVFGSFTVNPDGSKTYVATDSTQTTVFPDGSKSVTNPTTGVVTKTDGTTGVVTATDPKTGATTDCTPGAATASDPICL